MKEITALGDGLGKGALLFSFPDCMVVEVSSNLSGWQVFGRRC